MANDPTVYDEQLSLPDGYAAHTRIFKPAGPIKSVLVYLHGIQSHGGWYEASGRHLAQAGRLVVMPDRRGSGKNQVNRCDAASAHQLITDLRTAIYYAHQMAHDLTGHELPIDLLGVSWGGKLAMCFQEYDPLPMLILANGPQKHIDGVHCNPPAIRSLTLVAPGLCPLVSVPWSIKLAVAGCMLIGQKRRRFDLPLCDPTLFTDHLQRQAYIRDDPLALRQGTARLLFVSHQLDKLARCARERWTTHQPLFGIIPVAPPPCQLPIHLVLAGQDRIIDNERTRRWFAPLAQHLTVSEFPGGGHTLEFEPQPHDYYRCLSGWLEARDAD